MAKYYLTDKQLEKIVKESLIEILKEGIKINRDKRTVTFDDSDDGIQDGPVVDTINIPNGKIPVTVYSMFKRVNNVLGDANPALHGLKGEYGWNFTNKEDFWNRFDELLTGFFAKHSTDVIVVLPSNHSVNMEIAEHIRKVSPNTKIITDVIGKLTTLEVFRMADKEGSYFQQYWKKKGESLDVAFKRLNYYLDLMDKKHNGYFSYHDIDDIQMRQSLINTMEALPESYTLYNNEINDKNVLLLDDSITFGQSVGSAVNALELCYLPKSISLLTMFSRLYKDNARKKPTTRTKKN